MNYPVVDDLPSSEIWAEVLDRFNRRFVQRGPEDCWLWTGWHSPKGYGSFFFNGRNVAAHRAAYMFAHQQTIPFGLIVRHQCDTPDCVNPKHLLLGTNAENTADMMARGRHHYGVKIVYGEATSGAKLTEAQVREIRALAQTGQFLQRQLAAQFGVTRRTIGGILRRERWGWMTE